MLIWIKRKCCRWKGLTNMDLSRELEAALAHIDKDAASEIRKAKRAGQVRDMWRELADEAILEHTNGVYLFTDEDLRDAQGQAIRILQVYVDEAIYASELNAQRELIKWQLKEKFDEDIDEMRISVSRSRYRNFYPFRETEEDTNTFHHEINSEDIAKVDELAENLDDVRIKRAFREAMISNLRWNQTFFEENKNEN